MTENIICSVSGGTPGADSNSYTLFDSTVAFPAGTISSIHGISRLIFSVENANSGTLRWKMSVNKGTNWDQVGGDLAVTAAASGDISGPFDFLVDPYPDVQLIWVNGGSSQTTWRPAITLVRGQRVVGR